MILFKGKQQSGFVRRAVVKHRRRMVQQLKDGTSVQIYMIDQQRMGQVAFFDKERPMSQNLNEKQKSHYNQLWQSGLKNERTQLSKARFNKMKGIIMKEAKEAI